MATFPLHVRNAQLDAHNANLTVRIAQETATSDDAIATAPGATLAGDPMRLRGLPAIGSGAGGAIRGTQPGRNLQ